MRVDFSRSPDPPAPLFPGAGALRQPELRDAEDWYQPIRPMQAAGQAWFAN